MESERLSACPVAVSSRAPRARRASRAALAAFFVVAFFVVASGVGCGGRSEFLPSVGADRVDAGAPPSPLDAAATRSGAEAVDAASTEAAPCSSDGVDVIVSPDGWSPYRLLRFSPADAGLALVGEVDCQPVSITASINALAVSRSGDRYAVYAEQGVYRLGGGGGASLSCEAPGVELGEFQPLGVTFVPGGDGNDVLLGTFFVAVLGSSIVPGLRFGTVDVDSGTVQLVDADADLGLQSGLTATGDGRLFGLDVKGMVEVDVATGSVVTRWPSPDLAASPASPTPLAFWAGDVYVFRYPSRADGGLDVGKTDVVRFRPSDGTATPVLAIDGQVVAAGVSTCAPLQ